jgi:two-component system response regulator HydG
MQILLVEDEEIFQKAMIQSLRREGFQIKPACSGKEAWEILHASSIEMILLDIGLPDYDGLDLLEEVRRMHPKMPVIIITGQASQGKERRASRLGVSAFLSKPIHLKTLKETIYAICGGRREGG